jgi:hypothetical protein
MTEDMCWLVLHCRPGLVRHGWQGKREGRRETPEGQQRTAHHHLALALLPTTIPSLTITSASAVPTTSTPVTPITCCRVHYSPATPRPKTKRLDRCPVCLTGGLLRLHNSAQSRKGLLCCRSHGPTTNIHKTTCTPSTSLVGLVGLDLSVNTCHQIRLPV